MKCTVVLLLALVAASPQGSAQERSAGKAGKPSYIRIARDADRQPLSLQTAIARFVPESGRRDLAVDLVGVVHYGDASYYRYLDKRLAGYDVVLYELVAPRGTRVPRPDAKARITNPFALLQKLGTSVFGLESQLAAIDYTRKNFVHADLSPRGMLKAMRARGDDTLTVLMGVAADTLRRINLEQQKAPQRRTMLGSKPEDLLGLVFDHEAPARFKLQFAEQLASQADAGLGRTIEQLLIDDRNEAAIRVFQKQLTKGHRRIAIFYGAAHMPDFERRLKADFGLRRNRVDWVTAWDLQKPTKSGVEALLETFTRDLVRDFRRATPQKRVAPKAAKKAKKRRRL